MSQRLCNIVLSTVRVFKKILYFILYDPIKFNILSHRPVIIVGCTIIREIYSIIHNGQYNMVKFEI